MENKIFRSKSIDRISSPDQLNDYVRVSNPGVWMALVAIIVLLFGVCVWGIVSKMETTVPTAVIVNDGSAVCCVKEKDMENIKPGQTVRIKDSEYIIEDISDSPVSISAETNAYIMHIGSLSIGEWVYTIAFKTTLPNGVYEGEIVTKSVSPMSFLVN